MSAAADVARMLTLVPWCLQRPGASLAEAADAFGVSPDRIREDLMHLDFCGLPGLGGGDLFEVDVVGDRILLRMADELRRPLRLTPREALRLVLSLTAVELALGEDLPALRSGIDKIRDAAGLDADAILQAATDDLAALAPLRTALARGRRVRCTYRGRLDETARARMLDPWELVVTRDGWYLHAHDEEAGGHRTFRLDRMGEVTVLPEPITVDRPADELSTPAYVPSPDAPLVTLDLAPSARWLMSAISTVNTADDGPSVRVEFHVESLEWAADLVLMAAGGARVVTPLKLRQIVEFRAKEALSRYRAMVRD